MGDFGGISGPAKPVIGDASHFLISRTGHLGLKTPVRVDAVGPRRRHERTAENRWAT